MAQLSAKEIPIMGKQKVVIEVEYDLDNVKRGMYDLSSLDVIKNIQVKGVELNHGLVESAKFQHDLGTVINQHILVDVYGKTLIKPLSYPTKLVLSWVGSKIGFGRFNEWHTIKNLKGWSSIDDLLLTQQEKNAIFLPDRTYLTLQDQEYIPPEHHHEFTKAEIPPGYLFDLSEPVAKLIIDKFLKGSYYWPMFLNEMANFIGGREATYTWKIVERVINNSYGLTTVEIMAFILPDGNYIKTEYAKGNAGDLAVSDETLNLINRGLYQFNETLDFSKLLRLYAGEQSLG